MVVTRDGQELGRTRLDPEEHSSFCEVRPWRGSVVLGAGHRLVFFQDETSVVHRLGEAFTHLYEDEACLLVTTDARVWRFDGFEGAVWTSPQVGLDGVLVLSVTGGQVLGEGEWDPPGGWRPFALDLASGEISASFGG